MELRINQKTYQVDADADTPLLWVIRDDLGLTLSLIHISEPTRPY